MCCKVGQIGVCRTARCVCAHQHSDVPIHCTAKCNYDHVQQDVIVFIVQQDTNSVQYTDNMLILQQDAYVFIVQKNAYVFIVWQYEGVHCTAGCVCVHYIAG